MIRPIVRFSAVVFCGSLMLGCSGGPASIKVPPVDPASVASEAIDTCDTNGDEQVSRDEAAKIPGLLHAFNRYDRNDDNQISQDEIATRMEQLFGGEVGMFTLGVTVKLDGTPLAKAEVKLVPESCFGDTLKPASGVTRDNGRTMLSIAAADLPDNLQGVRGVNSGLYRVEITHPTIALPAKYNTETTLGRDVSQDDQLNGLTFNLKRR